MSIADKLTTVAENVSKVYASGKKAEYDEFWDAFQQNGNSTYYRLAFAGRGWNDTNFRPKYKIKPTQAYGMFWESSYLTDVSFADLDFSECTHAQMTFMDSGIKELGVIDMSKSTNISDVCASPHIIRIEKFIMPQVSTQYSNSPFRNATSLEHVIIEGTIDKGTFNVQWATKLDCESIISIVNALSDTTSGLTVTLSRTAVNSIDWTTTEYGSFQTLADTKQNWTISLL